MGLSGPINEGGLGATPDDASGPVNEAALNATPTEHSGPINEAQLVAVPGEFSGPVNEAVLFTTPTQHSGPVQEQALSVATVTGSGPINEQPLVALPGFFGGPIVNEDLEVKIPVKIKGKQIAEGAAGIATANLTDGVLSADAAGRGKVANGYFDAATVSSKFAAGAVALDRLAEAVLQADGGQTWTGDQNAGGQKLTNLAAPTADNDATTKAFVEALVQGLDTKESVRAGTTQRLGLEASIASGLAYANTGGTSARGQITAVLAVSGAFSFDGVALADGDRILLKNEGDASGLGADANGLYTVGIAGTALTLDRTTDFDEDPEVTANAYTFVEEGTVNGDNGFTLTGNDPITVGGASGSAQVWTQFSGAGSVVAGAGLSKAGNTLNVGDVNKGVQVNADDLQIDASEIAGNGLQQQAGVGNEHLMEVQPDSTTGGDVAPVSVGANGVGVDVTALDGDHLDIDFTPTNYTPDAGVAEAADVDDLAAHLKGIDDALGGVASPTGQDKERNPSATTGDGQDTGLTITSTPNGYVQGFLNGVKFSIGDGVKTKDAYFSASGTGGAAARAFSAIVAGDELYWNGVVAGQDLETDDEIDLDYNA